MTEPYSLVLTEDELYLIDRIPKLSFDEDNYAPWVDHLQIVGQLLQVWDHLDYQTPYQVSEEQDFEYFSRREIRARACIMFSLSEAALSIYYEGMTEEDKPERAFEVLAKLFELQDYVNGTGGENDATNKEGDETMSMNDY